jgi:hypothetical protein
MKLSLLYASFKGKELSKGSTLWNTFQNQHSEFKNLWMYSYLLKSEETKDNDSGAIEQMVPHLWVIMKNKSAGAKRNRLKCTGGEVKKISNSTLEEYKEGNYSSNWILTFHNFKTHVIIKGTCEGTAASAVELDDHLHT